MDPKSYDTISLLDKSETYSTLDPSNLRDRIAGLPDQCVLAWEEGSSLPLPDTYADAQAAVILGVGGSAIGGDLIAALAHLEKGPWVTVARDYTLPPWLGPRALVIASSYSGNTEETLAMYHLARERDTKLMAVTTGGTLGKLARQDNVPLLKVTYQGEPRSALGYSFIAPLAFLCRLGFLKDRAGELAEAARELRELAGTLSPQVPLSQNQAKGLAVHLHDTLPVVYGAGFLTAVARRWKTQLNENSKVWAFAEELPEANHNSAQGLALPGEVKGRVAVVFLHSSLLNPRTSQRFKVTQALLSQEGVKHYQVEAAGKTPLTQILSAVMVGDYVSYYLAMLNGVDPAATPALDWLKERMAATQSQ